VENNVGCIIGRIIEKGGKIKGRREKGIRDRAIGIMDEPLTLIPWPLFLLLLPLFSYSLFNCYLKISATIRL
jgi:hypothetical protein